MGAMERIAHPQEVQRNDTRGGAAANLEFLTFGLGSEEYGVDILKVQEIRQYEAPTTIANAPPYMKGVIDLRGVVVPIVDLRLKLRIGTASYDHHTIVVVLSLGGRTIGAVVDHVSEVVALVPEEIKPPPRWNGADGDNGIVGLATVDQGEEKRMLILVDAERLLADDLQPAASLA